MTAMWTENESGEWRLLQPTGFDLEEKLHDLVERAPTVLPLSGQPQMVVIGREVAVGSGAMDLLLVDTKGKLAVLEVKLSKNSEAKKAIVSQALYYAAFLKGMDRATLEKKVIRKYLQVHGAETVAEHVVNTLQVGNIDRDAFEAAFDRSLEVGDFRIIFVLDEAPAELIRVVGYLEEISEKIEVDLIVVSAYSVAGKTILMPQRIDPGREAQNTDEPPDVETRWYKGSSAFRAKIESDGGEHSQAYLRLSDWAEALEAAGAARLFTYTGKFYTTLLPYLIDEDAGMLTLYYRKEAPPSFQVWRSVVQRAAPGHMPSVVDALQPASLGQGTSTYDLTDQLLRAFTAAYEESAGKHS
jgi:hypothetical protein